MQRMKIDEGRYVVLERFSNGKAAVWDSSRGVPPIVFDDEEEAKVHAVMKAATLAANKAAIIFRLNHKARRDVVLIEPGGKA